MPTMNQIVMRLFLLIVGWLLVLSPAVHAFPDRPLTLVMPYPATGSPDIDGASRMTKLTKTMRGFSTPSLTDGLALELAQLLSGALAQPVNLERHPTGSTIAGTQHVVQAKPDGYTLLFAGNPTIAVYPSLYPRLSFSPTKDLAPVAVFAHMPMVMIARSDNPAQTVRQVTGRARSMPGKIDYAALGVGSTSHLTGELFRALAGVEMVHVNYNGGTPALNAVATGNVEFGFVPLPSVLPYLKAGRIKIVAVSSATRHAAVPHAPTIAESGLAAFDAGGWFGVFAPSATPHAIISRLNHAINETLSEDLLQRTLIARGLTAAPETPEGFRALIENDSARWARLLKAAAVDH